MRALLFIVGLLAIVSGGLKFRGRVMDKIGTSPFSLAEVVLGLLSCVMAVTTSGRGALPLATAGLTLIAVVAGSYHQSKLAARFHRRRELSEGHRLKRFVEGQDAAGTTGPQPSGDDHGT